MSKIEWTDKSWNPITGCTPISEGCKNCYAMRIFSRGLWDYDSKPRFHPERLGVPESWKDPCKVFIGSMTDIFHEDVPRTWILKTMRRIPERCPRHTPIILTKRPQRALDESHREVKSRGPLWPWFKASWMGVSAENQVRADERIPTLLSIPARLRFVSVEPMLGPVDIEAWLGSTEAERAHDHCNVEWVICGCESGPKRRPCDVDWIRSLRDQCVRKGVAFFLKQMDVDGEVVKIPELDGMVWQQWPDDEPS